VLRGSASTSKERFDLGEVILLVTLAKQHASWCSAYLSASSS